MRIGVAVWLLVAVIVTGALGVGIYLAVTHPDKPCRPGTHRVVTGYIPITTMAGKVPVTQLIPETECQPK